MDNLPAGSSDRHFTTRRGFVAACGFGIVGLYGLWAGYGAAPLPFRGGHGETGEGGAHEMAGGGHGAGGGLSPEEFRRLAEDFAARHRQPDGSVRPGSPMSGAPSAAMDHGAHGAHGMPAPIPAPTPAPGAMMDHGGHGAPMPVPASSTDPAAAMGRDVIMDHDAGAMMDRAVGPLDVYLAAFQWGFEPGVLRLDANRAYRFRMMAVDVTHGVALQFGPASRITRLRANTLVEQTMTFARPGEHLVYCTVYCGPGHARMQSRLIVERGAAS